MRTARLLKTTLWTAALMVTVSCGSSSGLGRHSGQLQEDNSRPRSARSDKKKKADDPIQSNVQSEDPGANGRELLDKEVYLQRVTDNSHHARFITSKVKFSVETGNRQMTLTGNLRMKRDNVIRLQLMAFGFVEAGRLEFTKEYVLIVDRINKQYIQVPYAQLDFLRNSSIDFYTLQALFWNELFLPGQDKVTEKTRDKFSTEYGVDNDVVVSLQSNKLSYRWLTDDKSARIKMANILYSDRFRGNYQLNWDYEEFKPYDRQFFPTQHKVSFKTPDREVKFDMILNYIGSDEDWETRTTLSGKYRQMPLDEILRRFMSL